MRLLVDGHNLIPKIPGFSLKDIDDEFHLIEWLQSYSRIKRRQVDVFFDQAVPACPQQKNYGMVAAHFARQGSTADAAIQTFLSRLGKSARNTTVVSSDRQVIENARSVHAAVISSEDFSQELVQLAAGPSGPVKTEKTLSEEEIAYWEAVFKEKPPKKP
jgi:uncharacterized protein